MIALMEEVADYGSVPLGGVVTGEEMQGVVNCPATSWDMLSSIGLVLALLIVRDGVCFCFSLNFWISSLAKTFS